MSEVLLLYENDISIYSFCWWKGRLKEQGKVFFSTSFF